MVVREGCLSCDKLEMLVAEGLRIAHVAGALRTKDLVRVTVDTTVQPMAITFPTDAKLLHAAIKGLNRPARQHGVRPRQSYLRIAKRAAMARGAMPTPSINSSTIIDNCASCAAGSAASAEPRCRPSETRRHSPPLVHR